MNDTDVKMLIINSVCKAAAHNQNMTTGNIPSLCEALFQWAKKK